MGRPAINTVFNTSLVDPSAGTTKNQFNTTPPSQQRTAFGGKFRTNVITTLTNINAVLGDRLRTDYDVGHGRGPRGHPPARRPHVRHGDAAPGPSTAATSTTTSSTSSSASRPTAA